MPSSWRPLASGLPTTPRKIGAHCARSIGKSSARNITALLVPPRMNTARNAIWFIRSPPPRVTPSIGIECLTIGERHYTPGSAAIVRGARTGDAAEDRTRHQARPARIVVMKEAANHLAASVQPRDRLPVGADDLRAIVDLEPAERKRDAARNRPCRKRRRIEFLRPVRFRQRQSAGRHAVAIAGIEAAVTGGHLVIVERAGRGFLIEIEFAHQIAKARGRDRFTGGIARFEQMLHLRIEDLPGHSARLVENDAAEFGVGEKGLVLALIDEALTEPIEHHPVRIGQPIGLVGKLTIAKSRGLGINRRSVTPAPLPPRHRADLERHPQPVGLIVRRAANLGMVPRPPEVLSAPRDICLEATASEHHRPRAQFVNAVAVAHDNADDAAATILYQSNGWAAVANIDAFALRRRKPHPREPDAFMHRTHD